MNLLTRAQREFIRMEEESSNFYLDLRMADEQLSERASVLFYYFHSQLECRQTASIEAKRLSANKLRLGFLRFFSLFIRQAFDCIFLLLDLPRFFLLSFFALFSAHYRCAYRVHKRSIFDAGFSLALAFLGTFLPTLSSKILAWAYLKHPLFQKEEAELSAVLESDYEEEKLDLARAKVLVANLAKKYQEEQELFEAYQAEAEAELKTLEVKEAAFQKAQKTFSTFLRSKESLEREYADYERLNKLLSEDMTTCADEIRRLKKQALTLREESTESKDRKEKLSSYLFRIEAEEIEVKRDLEILKKELEKVKSSCKLLAKIPKKKEGRLHKEQKLFEELKKEWLARRRTHSKFSDDFASVNGNLELKAKELSKIKVELEESEKKRLESHEELKKELVLAEEQKQVLDRITHENNHYREKLLALHESIVLLKREILSYDPDTEGLDRYGDTQVFKANKIMI